MDQNGTTQQAAVSPATSPPPAGRRWFELEPSPHEGSLLRLTLRTFQVKGTEAKVIDEACFDLDAVGVSSLGYSLLRHRDVELKRRGLEPWADRVKRKQAEASERLRPTAGLKARLGEQLAGKPGEAGR